jgi:hypothetical protein
MLSREERVRSFAHRLLKRLVYYEDSSVYKGEIPIEVDEEEFVGVYNNTSSDRIFVLLYGLYLEKIDRFIPYNKMISLETNHKAVGKLDANTILFLSRTMGLYNWRFWVEKWSQLARLHVNLESYGNSTHSYYVYIESRSDTLTNSC